MSHHKPDREDTLKQRRAEVLNLRKEGRTMNNIAIELGTSVHCVFRDVTAIRRFQTSTADTTIAPEECVRRKEPSEKPTNAKRRAAKRYFCLDCQEFWSWTGSWKPAKQHAEDEWHNVAQGTQENYRIRWAYGKSTVDVSLATQYQRLPLKGDCKN